MVCFGLNTGIGQRELGDLSRQHPVRPNWPDANSPGPVVLVWHLRGARTLGNGLGTRFTGRGKNCPPIIRMSNKESSRSCSKMVDLESPGCGQDHQDGPALQSWFSVAETGPSTGTSGKLMWRMDGGRSSSRSLGCARGQDASQSPASECAACRCPAKGRSTHFRV